MSSGFDPAPRWPIHRLNRFVHWPAAALSTVLEWVISPRGLIVLFFAAGAILATSTWVRPPLSRDLRAHQIPLQYFDNPIDPYAILRVPRPLYLFSPGSVMLCAIVVGAVVALVWPRRMGATAGVLLCLSILANAVLCLDYPRLFELLDSEFVQRQTIAAMLVEHDHNSLANRGQPRVVASPELPELFRGYAYLLYGRWLVFWAMFGVLFGVSDSIGRRLRHLIAWSIAGFLVSLIIGWPRVWAEVHWARAIERERRGDWIGARKSLEAALAQSPPLQQLRRVQLLRGRLDFRDGRTSTDEQLWRAEQRVQHDEHAKAIADVESLLATTGVDSIVSRPAAHLFTQVGLQHYRQGRTIAAERLWRRAAALDPERWDCRFLLGSAQAQVDPSRPELVDAEFAPLLGRLADRVLCADILASLGNAYFVAGQFGIARRHYQESLRVFELPKDINYRARRALVGM